MKNDVYLPILQQYIGAAQKRAKEGDSGVYQSSDQVAQVVLEVAQSNNPPLRIRTSQWSNEFTKLKTVGDPDGTKLVQEVINKTLK